MLPLENITSIGLTSARINHRNMWEISYRDDHGKERSIMILPRLPAFDNFIRKVKEKNNKAIIKNWSIG